MRCCKNKPDAVARVTGGEDAPQLSGCVRFYQENGCVLIEADVSGLPKASETGFFGFHIHRGRSCSGEGFSATEGHYNLLGKEHPEHTGDLTPLLCCEGNAYLSVKTDRFCVDGVIGRTVAIHSDIDDFRTQPAENAGRKIACDVIRKI